LQGLAVSGFACSVSAVRAEYFPPDHVRADVRAENIPPLRKTIGSIIRGFKIGVTKWMRQNTSITDVWHRNYFEHIIRNDKSYQTISNYIANNPAKWADDKFYTK
jgi:REP element-mobilizing transposase RayT